MSTATFPSAFSLQTSRPFLPEPDSEPAFFRFFLVSAYTRGPDDERPARAGNQYHLAGAAPAAAGRPGGLGRARPPLWATGLPLVAPLAPPGVRRRGRHPGGPRQ